MQIEIPAQAGQVLETVKPLFGGSLLGFYLYGSATCGGLHPDSDVDLLAVQGNDEEAAQIPPAYEGSYEAVQSKKKAVCRQNFADTDDNAADAEDLDYSDLTPADVPVQNASGETISAQEAEQPYVVKNDGFVSDAALGIEKAGGVALGTPNADGGVAEIVAYDEANGRAYVVNGQESVLNIFSVNQDGSFGDVEKLDVAALMAAEDASFTYGDMTSVAVSPPCTRRACSRIWSPSPPTAATF